MRQHASTRDDRLASADFSTKGPFAAVRVAGLAACIAGVGMTLVGCGYSPRDEYFAVRSWYATPQPGTNERIALTSEEEGVLPQLVQADDLGVNDVAR
ncbi:MAG: hypothetical protein SFZ23_00255 [Planctomycetota bacterium]|nr:hypothetical protein [Planctomycetota bacterium]